MIDKKQIVDNIIDSLKFNIKFAEWENIGIRRPLESHYAVVVWCEEDLTGKYFTVSIREHSTDTEWGKDLANIEKCANYDKDYDELRSVIWECFDLYDKYKEV